MPSGGRVIPRQGPSTLSGVEVRVVIRDQARPLPAATDRPSLSQRCGAISRRRRGTGEDETEVGQIVT